ncbi:MAG: M56 family metallopeptidase [Eubacterium sp.]|nr:M56 family metallopeptidase [Eubacterium sp.]
MGLLFLKVFNMSIAAIWLILAVLVLRLLLKNAPRWITCMLWAAVAFRLICPFTFKSAFSIIPDAETVNILSEDRQSEDQNQDDQHILNQDISRDIYTENRGISDLKIADQETAASVAADSEIADQEIAISKTADYETADQKISENVVDNETEKHSSGLKYSVTDNVADNLMFIWIAGVAAWLGYGLIGYIKLRKRVSVSINIRDNIYLCDDINSPFVMGFFKPLIYIPSKIQGGLVKYVIAHEQAHIKRHDQWWKPLGYVILSIHWFNPLCWIAFVLLCRDIEVACDEKVIRRRSRDYKASYSQALLNMSRPGKMITLYPLGFGAAGVKERIKRVLKYQKPGFWKMTAGIVCILGVSVCFLTDPKTAVDVESYETYVADINEFNSNIDKYSVENASISEMTGTQREYEDEVMHTDNKETEFSESEKMKIESDESDKISDSKTDIDPLAEQTSNINDVNSAEIANDVNSKEIAKEENKETKETSDNDRDEKEIADNNSNEKETEKEETVKEEKSKDSNDNSKVTADEKNDEGDAQPQYRMLHVNYQKMSAVKYDQYIYYTGFYHDLMRYDILTQSHEFVAKLGEGGGSNLVKYGDYLYLITYKDAVIPSHGIICRISPEGEITELAAGDEFEIRDDRLYYIVLDNVNDIPDVEYQRGQIFSMDLDRGTIIEHPDYDFSCSRLATRTYEYGMLGCVDPVDESGQWRPGKIQYFDNISGDLRTVVEMDPNGYIAEYAMADEYIVYLYYTWEDSDLISKLVIEKYDGTEKNEIDFSPVD